MNKFKNKKEFAKYINELGGIAYEVGGSIRDKLLGKIPKDHDYVITGIDSEKKLSQFNNIVGKQFPVLLINIGGEKSEIAFARKETSTGESTKEFVFNTNKKITIEEDLYRRDLTINSMAINILSQELIDPFDGVNDIKNRIIRHTSKAFVEDPLRVYRVARFAALLDFEVEETTLKLLRNMKNFIHHISNERIGNELIRVINNAINPRKFFDILKDCSLLSIHFPEINDLDVPDRHDGTSYNHTMKALNTSDNPIIRWGCLFHDFGKGRTPYNMHPRHYNHGKLGIDPIEKFCDRLKLSNQIKKFGIMCSTEHMKCHKIAEMKDNKIIKLISKNINNIDELFTITLIDSLSSDQWENIDQDQYVGIYDLINYTKNIINNVTGKTLIEQGYVPGPTFGNMLHQERLKVYRQNLN